jgi:hypothetical protein
VIHERLLETEFVQNYRALALCGARWLPDAIAERLVEFVRDGGLIICDNIPILNERGIQSDLLKPLIMPGEETQVVDDLAFALGSLGAGRVARFNQDLNEFYSSTVDRTDLEARRRIKATVAQLLRDRGLTPLATTSDPEVEIGVRLGRDYALAIAVNHTEQNRAVLAVLPSLPFRPGWAVDALRSNPLPILNPDGVPTLELEVPAMDGRMVALYPEEPTGLDVAITPGVRRDSDINYQVQVLTDSGRPARGRHVVHATVWDAKGRVRIRYGGERATLDGVLARSVPMAINEIPGQWTLEARDPLGRRVARRTFRVR